MIAVASALGLNPKVSGEAINPPQTLQVHLCSIIVADPH